MGTVTTGPGGGFRFAGIPPGEYFVEARVQAGEYAYKRFEVDELGVANLVVTARRASSLTGVVTTETGSRPPFASHDVRVVPVAAAGDMALPTLGSPRTQAVNADWSFGFTNIDAQYLFRLTGLPPGWLLKAVIVNDREVTDLPFVPPAGSNTSARLIVSPSAATLKGRVTTSGGAVPQDAAVVVFPRDPSKWHDFARYVAIARTGMDGSFTVSGLPRGEYLAACEEFVTDDALEDPSYLRRLTGHSVAVTLADESDLQVELLLARQP
jgi:hypothetical protein